MKRMPTLFLAGVFGLLLLSSLAASRAQQNGTGAAKPSEPESSAAPDPLSQLSPDQRQVYEAAVRQFSAEQYADALTGFKRLMTELQPGAARVIISKYASEAALNVEAYPFAKDTLKPITDTDPNDWQAAGMLARLYAETGEKQARDAELAHIVDLHKRAVTPQIAKMQQILIERIPIQNGFVRVWYSLEPWGQYKTYLFSRVYNTAGEQVLRIALESSDFDQPAFAKQHPDLAAAGVRSFSLDTYSQPEKLPNGGGTLTHGTYGFFDGQPSYDTIRQKIIEIVNAVISTKSKTEAPKDK